MERTNIVMQVDFGQRLRLVHAVVPHAPVPALAPAPVLLLQLQAVAVGHPSSAKGPYLD